MSEKAWIIAMAVWIAPILLIWFNPESWQGASAGLLPVLFSGFWSLLCWAVIITVVVVRHV